MIPKYEISQNMELLVLILNMSVSAQMLKNEWGISFFLRKHFFSTPLLESGGFFYLRFVKDNRAFCQNERVKNLLQDCKDFMPNLKGILVVTYHSFFCINVPP